MAKPNLAGGASSTGDRAWPLVSVLVPTLDGPRLLEQGLPSLTSQSYPNVEIIVVDNADRVDTRVLADRFQVGYVALDRNYGFAPAINRGALAAKGTVLIFVNDDMRFDEAFVERLAMPILNGHTFATDARQLSWEGTKELHGASRLVQRGSVDTSNANRLLPLLDVHQSYPESEMFAFQACGGNMAVDRTRFESLGRFDDRLVAGWEDTDLAWRAWAIGWQTLYVPSAVCWHRVGVTSDSIEGAQVRLRGSLGGRLLFATKYLPIEHVALTWGHAIAGLLRSILREGWQRSKPRARIILDLGRLVPTLVRERRTFYRETSGNPRDQLTKMCAIGRSS
jgi:GT2 family glycosyltransferase